MKKMLSSPVLVMLGSVFAAASIISGCSSSTSSPAGFTYTNPKPGSSYTYSQITKDSSSGSPGKTYDSTKTAIVVQSDVAFQGKQHVIALKNDSASTTSDTLYYAFESNGDVSVYIPTFGANGITFVNKTPWLRLPFGSKDLTDTLFVSDTTISFGSASVPLHLVAVAGYLGTDEIDINGGPKLAGGGRVNVTIYISSAFLGASIKASQTYSIDPTIGCYFHSVTGVAIPKIVLLGINASTSSTERILTSFSLVK